MVHSRGKSREEYTPEELEAKIAEKTEKFRLMKEADRIQQEKENACDHLFSPRDHYYFCIHCGKTAYSFALPPNFKLGQCNHQFNPTFDYFVCRLCECKKYKHQMQPVDFDNVVKQ
jgi:hypothetical protein